jgi:hypothetical protein
MVTDLVTMLLLGRGHRGTGPTTIHPEINKNRQDP